MASTDNLETIMGYENPQAVICERVNVVDAVINEIGIAVTNDDEISHIIEWAENQ